ncbi:MAG: nuclear transport factor 2 family protein [Bryobacteraceae bacterium]|jgi:ketosteroid isomerase-like protein
MAIASCNKGAGDNVGNRIIAMERAALDRWGKGDVNGYLDLDSTDITYFDPALEKRVDGLAAVKKYIAPFAGKIGISHYSMIDPKVQQYGDIAVLTYNLVDDVIRTPDGPVNITIRWNCTQVYARIDGEWKIVHNHWSYTRPDLKKSE